MKPLYACAPCMQDIRNDRLNGLLAERNMRLDGAVRRPGFPTVLHASSSCYRRKTMNNDLIRGARALPKGSIRRVHESELVHHRIECLGGTLWITQDGDRRDIILGSGESFTFDR